MKIKRLILNQFGSYETKVIELSDGTNLILEGQEGLQETLFAFLESMFFSPTEKIRKEYLTETSSGEMELDDVEGDRIRIVKQFRTGEVQFFSADGEKITDKYPDGISAFLKEPFDSVYPLTRKGEPNLRSLEEELQSLVHDPRLLSLYEKERELRAELEAYGNDTDPSDALEKKIRALEHKREEIREGIAQTVQGRDFEIHTIEQQNEEIIAELEKLEFEDNQIDKNSRTRLLERNEKGADERIHELTARLNSLYEEQDEFTDRLSLLKSRFTLNEAELEADHKKLQSAILSEETLLDQTDLVNRIKAIHPAAVYLILLLGIAIDGLALFVFKGRLSFYTMALVLFIGTMLFGTGLYVLMLKRMRERTLSDEARFEPISAQEAVLQKYRRESVEDFTIFYDRAKKLFEEMDNLQADLHDIDQEITQAKEELDQFIYDREAYLNDLNEELESQGDQAGLERKERMIRLREQFDKNMERISSLKKNPDFENPVIVTTPDGKELRAESFFSYLDERIKAAQIQRERQTGTSVRLVEMQVAYKRILSKISEYQEKIEALKRAIKREGELSKRDDVGNPLVEELGISFPRNVLKDPKMVLIVNDLDPTLDSVQRERLLDELLKMSLNRQVLLFLKQNDTLNFYQRRNIPYTGILLTA